MDNKNTSNNKTHKLANFAAFSYQKRKSFIKLCSFYFYLLIFISTAFVEFHLFLRKFSLDKRR